MGEEYISDITLRVDHLSSNRFSATDVVSHAPRVHSRDLWAKKRFLGAEVTRGGGAS